MYRYKHITTNALKEILNYIREESIPARHYILLTVINKREFLISLVEVKTL